MKRIELIDAMFREPSQCEIVLQRAAEYYKQPIADLKLKKPIEQLYADADTDEPIGTWVTNIPKPGDVAGCIKQGGRRESRSR